MAETAAGGWVRSAARSAASTRPWASLSAAFSGASATASLSTPACASATESIGLLLGGAKTRGAKTRGAKTRGAKMAGLAAALLDQMDALDAHVALDRLHHVVDREAGDRYRGQRLHLDAGLAGDLDGRPHGQAGRLFARRDVD